MVPSKKGAVATNFGHIRKSVGRQIVQVGVRHRGLSIRSHNFLSRKGPFPPISTSGGHVCLPGQQTVRKICSKVATSPGGGGGCIENGPHLHQRVLCKPPLENNRGMAAEIKGQPPGRVPHGGTQMGWCELVAPTSTALRQESAHRASKTSLGSVQKLPGSNDAAYQMAPSLSEVLRASLEAKQMESETITCHLNSIRDLKRYDGAFRCFYAFCVQKGLSPVDMSLGDIAAQLSKMSQVSLAQARNAYSALLLLPQYFGLRFQPLLKICKRKWNSSCSKYADFWPAESVLKKLLAIELDWCNVQQVRDRFILCSRLLQLTRSIDLARTWRNISRVAGGGVHQDPEKGSAPPRLGESSGSACLPHAFPLALAAPVREPHQTANPARWLASAEFVPSLPPPCLQIVWEELPSRCFTLWGCQCSFGGHTVPGVPG